jgi:hypothetical protein
MSGTFHTDVKVELILLSMTLGSICCAMSGTILKVTIIITIWLSLQLQVEQKVL